MRRIARPPAVLLLLLLLLSLQVSGDLSAALGQRSTRRETAANLLLNGDFAKGARGWFAAGGLAVPTRPGTGTIRIETRGGPDHSPCLRLDGRGQTHRVRASCTAFRFHEGRRYRVSFHARVLGDEEVRFAATIEWLSGREPTGSSALGNIVVRTGDWARYGYDVTVPDGVERGQLTFTLPAGRAGLVDDVSVAELIDHLEISSFSPSSAVLATGEEAQLLCTVVNAGSTTIPSVAGEAGLEGALEKIDVGDLEPGEVHVVVVDLPPLAAGVFPARARFQGRLGAPVLASTNVLVHDPGAPGELFLESGDARLLFRRVNEGYGVIELLVREEGSWRTVGVIPGLARVRLSTDTIDGVLTGEVRERGEGTITGRAEHHGLTFDFTWKSAGDGWFELEVLAQARRSVDLAALYFPEVHAGWGANGALKDSAVFGGLELLDGTQDSSGLDAANEEMAPRFVPHPLEVTIPVMSVEEAGTAIGLSWDPLQRWDGRRTKPSSLFASPNRWTDQDDHLLALFLPSIPEYVDPGRGSASRPCSLFRGQKISLRAELFLLPAPGGAIDTLAAWYRRHGAPEPAERYTRWEPAGRVAASAMLSRWDERAAGWPYRGVDEPDFYPEVALNLLLFAIHEGGALGKRVLAQLEKVLARLEDRDAVKRLGIDLALHVGHVPENLEHLGGVLAELRVQNRDGSFPYRPDELSQHDPTLGEAGQVCLGTCDDSLRKVLRYATLTGNPTAYRAALRGLEFTESLVVPTGSQTWEVPILAPDLLAAQQGIDLQLSAYRLTGDERHLEEAKRWAKCGLAFVSTWEDPDRPAQLYASTAVFGASWYTIGWWGMPVQWIGLVYGGALLRLAPYDPDFPWETIARGLYASCLQQQKMAEDPRLEQPWAGCYADYYRLHDGLLKGTWLAPWTILREMNTLAGRLPTDHARIGGGIGRGLTTAARIEALTLEETAPSTGTVTARLTYPSGQICHSIFGQMAAPSAIFAGRRELKRVNNLEGVREGWWYDEETALAVIKHRFAGGVLVLRIEGVSSRVGGRR